MEAVHELEGKRNKQCDEPQKRGQIRGEGDRYSELKGPRSPEVSTDSLNYSRFQESADRRLFRLSNHGNLVVIAAPGIGPFQQGGALVTFASLVLQHDRTQLLIAGGSRASHCSARSRAGESGTE
jgi:hypothetical protein